MTEGSWQRTEVGGQRSEVRRQRTAVRIVHCGLRIWDMGCEMWDMPTIRMAHSEKADFEFALCSMPCAPCRDLLTTGY